MSSILTEAISNKNKEAIANTSFADSTNNKLYWVNKDKTLLTRITFDSNNVIPNIKRINTGFKHVDNFEEFFDEIIDNDNYYFKAPNSYIRFKNSKLGETVTYNALIDRISKDLDTRICFDIKAYLFLYEKYYRFLKVADIVFSNTMLKFIMDFKYFSDLAKDTDILKIESVIPLWTNCEFLMFTNPGLGKK